MRLSLEEANAVIELRRDGLVLVGKRVRGATGADAVRVVSANVGDIAVEAGAQLRVAVAGGGAGSVRQ